jgi:membrane-bound lytic murein transglycosylase D
LKGATGKDLMVFITQAATRICTGVRHGLQTRLLRFLMVVLALSAQLSAQVAAQGSEHFPVPDSIRPAIGFWIKVYTEADTESGFLHDSQNLSVIYEKLPRDRALIEQRRKELVADLKVLAAGKRDGLSNNQQRLLELWGSKTSNQQFTEAAQNVRWQLGQSDRYLEGLVRSGAYRPHIDKVIRDMGLPPELAMLPHVESSFHPGAQSSVAATGMWQFMRETATRFMRVDAVVDDRLDPYTSSVAAMQMLKSNYEMLGTWPLALTGYNHGPNGMARAVRDAGTRDIGRIISEYKGSRFGFASRNFYPQFLAALEVDRNAESYFGPVVKQAAPEFQSVEMKAYMDAAVVAQSLGVSLDTLKRYNPALLPVVWSGNKRIPKGYQLKMDSQLLTGNLETSLNSIAATHFHSGQVPDVSYKVQSGDSLSGIASRFKTSVAELVAINQLRDRHSIRAGQTLVLPQQNGSVPTLVVNRTEPQPVQARPQTASYVVQRGDTVSNIARRFGVSAGTLLALNGLDNRGLIQPGQTLRLQADGSAAALAASNQPSAPAAMTTAPVAMASAPAALGKALTASLEQTQQQFTPEHGNVEATFAVAADGTVEILPDETLGHYADWLLVDSKQLLQANNLRSSAGVRVGERLVLDFSKVDQSAFSKKRRDFHNRLQEKYFAAWRIRDTEQYSIRQSDLVMSLAQKRDIPMWLFRQYNPAVDISRVKVGQVVVFPVVERITN